MSAQDVLSMAGYPVDYLVLDFESFYSSTYSLSKISTIEYVKSEQFELLECLGCGFGHCYKSWSDGQTRRPQQFIEPDDLQNYFDHVAWDDTTIVAKNAKFDILVLQEIYGITPKYIIDIEDISRHQDSRDKHSLKHLAVKHKLGVKGRTEDFKGLRWADMTPEQREALAEYCATGGDSDINLERQLFELLLPQLTNPLLEIPLMRHTLDIYLQPRISFDFVKADKLIEDMYKELWSVVDKTGEVEKDISGNISFAKLLQAALGDEKIPVKMGKRGNIPALAQTDEGRRKMLEHPNEQVRLLMEARIAVQSWPLHIKRVKNLIAQAKANGGKLSVPLKYYGGHTGRWSGSGGINLQNLGGAGRGKAIHPLIGAVRGLLRA